MPSQPAISRQAVIVIHGIGEQHPMDTLRGFADAVAPPNQNPDKPAFFSKPDHFSGTFELRRLTANRQRNTFKTDYFELYWAHLMTGTELLDIVWWARAMFFRRPSSIPKRLRWLFWIFWGLILLTLGIIILFNYREACLPDWLRCLFRTTWFKPTVSVLFAVLSLSVNIVLLTYLGDAVRYFTPRPRNVPERQKIRKAGVSLLRQLHDARTPDGRNLYDRIIIVGHSLGSVIAYDILCLFWNEISPKLDLQPTDIDTIEAAASALEKQEISLDAYRQAQFTCWASQYKTNHSWRISDLITVGSPLAYADLHLANNPAELAQKQREREFATNPPRTEPPTAKQQKKLIHKDKTAWFSYPASDDGTKRTLHHAAPFAMTRWTNMFFTNDYVGGPVTCFGPGVENKQLISQTHNALPFISHTHYWDKAEPESLHYLQAKMQLTFAAMTPNTTKTE